MDTAKPKKRGQPKKPATTKALPKGPAAPRTRANRGETTSKAALVGQRMTFSGLTVEQEAYARCRAMGMSKEEAVVTSGAKISIATAREWERFGGTAGGKVAARIDELANIASANAILKTGLDREWVIKRLMQVTERCMQAEPVLDKKGEPTGEYQFDSSGANQALRMLGDTMGMFKPTDKKPEDDYANLSDDDLARIAQEYAAVTGIALRLEGTQATPGHEQAGELQTIQAAD